MGRLAASQQLGHTKKLSKSMYMAKVWRPSSTTLIHRAHILDPGAESGTISTSFVASKKLGRRTRRPTLLRPRLRLGLQERRHGGCAVAREWSRLVAVAAVARTRAHHAERVTGGGDMDKRGVRRSESIARRLTLCSSSLRRGARSVVEGRPAIPPVFAAETASATKGAELADDVAPALEETNSGGISSAKSVSAT